MADACGIQHPQGAIPLGTPLLKIQRVVGRATQGSIWLRSKGGTGKAMRKGDPSEFRRAIDDRRRGYDRGRKRVSRESLRLTHRSKLGGA